MARKLDRSRDFGVVQGDDQGRMFEQDGVFFTGDGAEWGEPKKRAGKAAAAGPVDDGAVAAEVDQLAAQLQD